MTPRALAAALLIAAVVLCTIADVRTLPPPALTDGYYVLAGDFHIHAAFGDGGLPPWDIRREAARRGLDVVAIANHNQVYSPRLHRRLFGTAGLPLLLVGEEVTAPTHHIIAVGVPSAVDWNQSTAATIRDIHARGGIAIAAHPQGDTADGYDEEALALLDAAERTHPGMYRTEEVESDFEEFFARARRLNSRVAAVGDSDFHFTGAIGMCRTYVLTREVSEAGVLNALREGRSVAYDLYGQPYGDPTHVSTVEAARSARVIHAPAWARWMNTASVWLAWAALVAIVLLGPAVARP